MEESWLFYMDDSLIFGGPNQGAISHCSVVVMWFAGRLLNGNWPICIAMFLLLSRYFQKTVDDGRGLLAEE